MKKIIILLFVGILSSKSNAQLNYQMNKSSFRFGGGYSHYSEDNGFVFFNETQFHVWKNFSAGPNIYFSRVTYNFDSKAVETFLFGIDLNIYYNLKLCKSTSIQLGPGYTFRHRDNNHEYQYFYPVESYVEDKSNMSQFIANLNIEKGITNHFNLGLKMSWQPMGTQEVMYYAGIYGGFVF